MARRRPDRHISHIAAWLEHTGSDCAPDRAQAERFLYQLDREAAYFSFRTFSETPYTRLPGHDPLEYALHGSLDECWSELFALNRAGAVIGVTINETDGRGRDVEHIRRVRALFVDDDQPDRRVGGFAQRPHLTVESSPGRFHHYWRVEGVSRDEFPRLQQRLTKIYKTDHRVFGLNQSMGLPGFWRRKRLKECVRTELRLVVERPPLTPDEVEVLLKRK